MATWLDRVANIVRLTRAGVMVLVDDAWDARLPELLRALRADQPAEVCTDFDALSELPVDSTVVFAPHASQAAAMNAGRPRIANRRLRVVLWCSRATARAIARDAPDFFDWVSHRVECPRGLPPHVLATMNAAEQAHVRGVVCTGLEQLDEASAEFLETEGWEIIEPFLGGFDDPLGIVDLERGRRLWIEGLPVGGSLMDLRIALAAADTRGPIVVDAQAPRTPGWWSVDATTLALSVARQRLGLGAELWTDTQLALLGGEPETIDLARRLVAAGVSPREMFDAMVGNADAGASLAVLALRHRVATAVDVARMTAPVTLLRGLSRHPSVVREARKMQRAIAHALESGREVPPEDLGWFVARASQRAVVPERVFEVTSRENAAFLLEAYLRQSGAGTIPPERLLLAALSVVGDELRAALIDLWEPRFQRDDHARVLLEARRLEDAEEYTLAVAAYRLVRAAESRMPVESSLSAQLGIARVYRRMGRYEDALRAAALPPWLGVDEAARAAAAEQTALICEATRSALLLRWSSQAWEGIVALAHVGPPGSRVRRAAIAAQSRLRAAYLLANGRLADAEAELLRSRPATRDAEWFELRAEAALESGQFDDALKASMGAVTRTREGTLARADVDLLRARIDLERGDPESGRRRAAVALAMYQHRIGPEYHFAGRCHRVIAECLLRSGQPEPALAALVAADHVFRAALPAGHPERIECALALKSVPGHRDSPGLELAFAALESVLGAAHPVVRRWRARIQALERASSTAGSRR